MDPHNLFATRTTYRALRAEYGVGLVVAAVLVLTHFDQIRWAVFIPLFLIIDVIGYLPGTLAWHRSPEHRIARVYYVLYNIAHSGLTGAAVVGLWCVVVRPEWALLAVPLHLCGDRALFGNILKPFGLSFEPVPLPAYEEFARHYDQHAADQRFADPSLSAPVTLGALGPELAGAPAGARSERPHGDFAGPVD
jgi:hypothetical protein